MSQPLAVPVRRVRALPRLEVEPEPARCAAPRAPASSPASRRRCGWRPRCPRCSGTRCPWCPAAFAPPRACTSMCASTQWGITSCSPNVTSTSCSAASTAATDSGAEDTGLVPSTTSPTAKDQPLKTCQRMSSGCPWASWAGCAPPGSPSRPACCPAAGGRPCAPTAVSSASLISLTTHAMTSLLRPPADVVDRRLARRQQEVLEPPQRPVRRWPRGASS